MINERNSLYTFKKYVIYFLAFGFGSGLIKKAPGTWGTFVALILWWFFLGKFHWIWYTIVLAVLIVIGIYICGEAEKYLNCHDPSRIVWDEFCGYWITMYALPSEVIWVILGFIVFRVLDIVKPPPIRWIDQKVTGGLGIMLDDMIAGLFACFFLHGAKLIYELSFSSSI